MLFLSRPDEGAVRSFLASQKGKEFSYPHAGATKDGFTPRGFSVDHNRVHLGNGAHTFGHAVRAMQQWKMFAMPWVELCFQNTPIEEGAEVAVLISHFGFWSLNACRIVRVWDERGENQIYGFAYGTLPDHAERGEERFTVELHKEDGSVWYDLYSHSRPNGLARLAYPLTRLLQKRFARDSKIAMKEAVEAL
jgi:uncharacterized protein (UPF0548 family)